MKLTPTYNARGEQRAFYEGEDGREYFMYQDRTGYTVREMNKDDVEPWYNAMKIQENMRIAPMQKVVYLAKVSQKVDEMIGESMEKTMLVINPQNQIIGEIDFQEDEKCEAIAQVFLKDKETVKSKGSKVIQILQRMNATERLYDALWLENEKSEKVRIS